MPRTRFDKPRYQPINELRAVILERKFTAKLSWADIAKAANMQPDTMRQLAIRKPPQEWPEDVLKSVCRLLDLKVTQTITDLSSNDD